MGFDLSLEDKAFRDRLRAWLRKNVLRVARLSGF